MRYQMPTHLCQPDRIALPFFIVTIHVTVKQFFWLTLLLACCFQLFRMLSFLSDIGPIGVWVRVALVGLIAGLAALLILVRIRRRELGVWVLVLVRYWLLPKVAVWYPIGREEAPHA
jgi:hypothetical protein